MSSREHLIVRVAICAGLTLPALGYGQTTNEAEAKPENKEKVEKMEVTGSYIKRIDIEGPSPVIVLDQDFLEKTGATSVSDVLRNNPTSSFGAFKESTGNTFAAQAFADLRGLGPTRTLVLLDGKRLPPDAASGAVDLNNIPMAAVERIEILKDGASATYGSDALGGVINIITKKNYNGAEVSSRFYSPEKKGGAKQEYSITGGTSNANTSLTTTLYYQKREPIWARDRKWEKEGTSTLGSPGSYRSVTKDAEGNTITGKWNADPNCPEERLQTTSAGTRCTYVYANDASIYPEMETLSSLTNFRHDVTDRCQLFSRAGATRKRTSWEFAPAPGVFQIPSSAADTLGPDGGPLPGVEAGSDIEAAYRLTELGNRRSEIETTAFNIMGGFNLNLFNSWDLEVSASQNRVRRLDMSVSGYAIESTLRELIAENKFNPYAAPAERGSLDEAFYQPWQLSISTQKSRDAKVTGELFDLPGGPVGVAVGYQAVREEYTDQIDNLSVQGLVYGSAGSSGGGSRDVESVFVEFGLPVLENLEVQLAARQDRYSDFGTTTNPKAAVRYQVLDSLLVRASYGTGFKAPNLVDLYAADSYGYPFFVDETSCKRVQAENPGGDLPPECREQQYLVKSSGNEGLEEEKSTSMNIGFVFQPTQYVNLGLDYWKIDIDNQVGIDYNDLAKAEAAGVDVASKGITINRDSNGNITEIDAPLQNLSSQKIAGYDLRLAGRTPKYSFGTFGLATEHSKLMYFKEEGFPGVGFRDKLGERSRPAWRNNTTLSYGIGAFESELTARVIAGQEKDVKEEGDLPDYVEWDAALGYSTFWNGKFLAGGTNIFGATPPLDDSNPQNQLEAAIYDQVGRTFYVGYKQSF